VGVSGLPGLDLHAGDPFGVLSRTRANRHCGRSVRPHTLRVNLADRPWRPARQIAFRSLNPPRPTLVA
jgi:hypothetical protein